jgi:hypothetical protein
MKHSIRVLGSAGDTPLEYNPEVDVEFKQATDKFHELQGRGFSMFAVDPETKETTLIQDLFKTTPQVVAIPQISGG